MSDLIVAAGVSAGIILYIVLVTVVVGLLATLVNPIAAILVGAFLILTPCMWAVTS